MTNRVLILLGGFVLALALGCLAQVGVGQQYFLIENVTSDAGSGEYSIPLIKSNTNPDAAYKINEVIQLAIVGKSYGVAGKSIFDGMLNENGYGTESLGYTILLNSSAILSIKFNDQTISSYPDSHTYYLNFNSTTGDIIDLTEILNKTGFDHLNDLAGRVFNTRIKERHSEILAVTSMDADERRESLDYVFDLTECNATHEIWKFGISGEFIIVEKDQCFPHVIQAHDISWVGGIKIKDLYSSDFTAYGKSLVKEGKADNSKHFNSKESVMTLHGKIDAKYPFTMYLRINDDNSIGGAYWYDKFGKLVDFKGSRVSDTKIELIEEGGKFVLTILNTGEISGNWYNKEGRPLPIIFY